ncbi:MAG: general secretion pathway protein GspF [Gammaproteobacteria bacterium]
MVIKQKRRAHKLDEPILHENHKRPVTRREFLGAGLISGSAMVLGNPLTMSLLSNPAYAATRESCGLEGSFTGRIPFIAFDLGGGANMTGSNVLVGGPGGQMDFLSTAGYNKLGLPGDMVPGLAEATPTTTSNGDHTDTSFGLAFHSDSAFLRGMLAVTSPTTRSNTNGCVIPARSDNDTGNNPHNPMYLINMAGATGNLLGLIGSQSAVSGARSMAPATSINLKYQPTKVDRASDVTGLVDTGGLVGLLSQADAGVVMESIERLSAAKMGISGTGSINATDVVKDLVHCGYLKTTDNVNKYGDPASLDLFADPNVTGILGGGITVDGVTADLGQGFYEKVAAVMKLVIDGEAAAGSISEGGYDYHNGTRATGELRDLRAGIGIGMCLEYAARSNPQKPVMIYVYSDGSLASNGRIDDSVDGRGKGEWTGDNSSTAASFFLVYNPGGRPTLLGGTPEEQAVHQQLGWMRSSASVETSGTTPGANNVNLLAQMVMLNYLALHGEQNLFEELLNASTNRYLGDPTNPSYPQPGVGDPNDPRNIPNGLGSDLDRLIAFAPIV